MRWWRRRSDENAYFRSLDAAAIAVGADDVATALEQTAEKRGQPIQIVRTGSRGLCWLEPMVEVATAGGPRRLWPGDARQMFPRCSTRWLTTAAPSAAARPRGRNPLLKRQNRLTFARCGITDPLSLDDYRAHGGFKGLERALSMTPAQIVAEVTTSGLRGRGGAGFPTGIKWKTVADAKADRKYIVCNADEGDSGTFADRMIMEGDPFVLIEGMTIAGIAVGADQGLHLYPLANIRTRSTP